MNPCLHCAEKDPRLVISLGYQPLANSYLKP